jgi:hypothetical protein
MLTRSSTRPSLAQALRKAAAFKAVSGAADAARCSELAALAAGKGAALRATLAPQRSPPQLGGGGSADGNSDDAEAAHAAGPKARAAPALSSMSLSSIGVSVCALGAQSVIARNAGRCANAALAPCSQGERRGARREQRRGAS